jgi:hypothetical protein
VGRSTGRKFAGRENLARATVRVAVFPLASRWDPRGWGVGRRAKRDTDLRFAARRVLGVLSGYAASGLPSRERPQPGRCRAQPTLSNSHLARRPYGEARGLLVVPRWFLTKFPIYGTAPQHKLSRVKPLSYAARQLTIELPTSSDKVTRSEALGISRSPKAFKLPEPSRQRRHQWRSVALW